MRIHLDVKFPHIPCFAVALDVMDVAGEHQNGVDHDMHKTRLDSRGIEISKEKLQINVPKKNGTDDPNYCGTCYGARKAGECCNTCDSVRQAYKVGDVSLWAPLALTYVHY